MLQQAFSVLKKTVYNLQGWKVNEESASNSFFIQTQCIKMVELMFFLVVFGLKQWPVVLSVPCSQRSDPKGKCVCVCVTFAAFPPT